MDRERLMDDDDPFAWISARCCISASQEEILRNMPYVLPNYGVCSGAKVEEGMSSSEDGEDEVRDMDTTIVMVSVPESSNEGNGEEEEVYRTAPERNSHSLTSSNEAKIGSGEGGGEDEVDFGSEENKVKTVDLSRDSELDGCEFGLNNSMACEDGLVGRGECLPGESVILVDSGFSEVDSLHLLASLAMEEEVGGRRECTGVVRGTDECVKENAMDEDVKMEDVGLSTGQEDGRVLAGSDSYVEDSATDECMLMEEEGVPSNDCRGVTRGVEAVAEGSQGLSLKAVIKRIFGDIVTESGTCLRDVGVVNVSKLQDKGSDVLEKMNRVGCAATSVCASGSGSSEFCKLPSSVCIGSREDGGAGDDQGGGKVRTDRGDGACASEEGSDPEPKLEDGGAGTGDKDGGDGKEASEPMNKEPNEEEQTDVILKVLGFLSKPQRPVYKEKVDIIGSAIKVGITFPRPSWWPEDSDDDSD